MIKISIFWKTILLFLAYLFLANGVMLLFYFLTESPETITSDITKAVITDASVITKNIEDEIKNRKDTQEVKSLEELKIILQGYTITVSKENMQKIATAVKNYVPENKG